MVEEKLSGRKNRGDLVCLVLNKNGTLERLKELAINENLSMSSYNRRLIDKEYSKYKRKLLTDNVQ